MPENPPCDAEGCLGRLGMESFLEPQVLTHAARVRVDRETGVVRVLHVAFPTSPLVRAFERTLSWLVWSEPVAEEAA